MAILTDWTLEQFLRLPEAKPALEFEGGRISQKVSPTTEHSVLQKHLVKLFDSLGVGQAFPELRTILPTASKVPDVAFYTASELPIGPTGRWLRYPEWVPTVAIEIASSDQDLEELREKCRFYTSSGSRLALLLLPEREAIRVFRRGQVRNCDGRRGSWRTGRSARRGGPHDHFRGDFRGAASVSDTSLLKRASTPQC
jgi:Uma2 family endonuclease